MLPGETDAIQGGDWGVENPWLYGLNMGMSRKGGGAEREGESEKIIEELMAEYFPSLMKNIELQTQEAQPRSKNKTKHKKHHKKIYPSLTAETQRNRKNLKAGRKVTHWGITI